MVTLQIKNVIILFSQGLWTLNFAAWGIRVKKLHPQNHVTHQPSGHVTNQRRYNTIFTRPMDLKLSRRWLRMREPPPLPKKKVTWYINHVVMWQIKVVISPLSQGLWISNLGGYWLFCGCYDRGLHRRKLDNPGISLLLSLVVKKSILYEMLKKPPRYKGKLVLTKNKRKNQKCRLELRVLRSTRFWIIQKFVCITATVNPVALKLQETATGGVQ